MKIKKYISLLLLLAVCHCYAHEGHDHGEARTPITQVLAPRISAFSEDLELLGILQNKELIIYLDRFDSNEPVINAKINVESGSFKAAARPLDDGTFALSVDSLAAGIHPVIFTVHVGDESDLLEGKLEIPTVNAGVSPRLSLALAMLFFAVGFALTLFAIKRWRRRSIFRGKL